MADQPLRLDQEGATLIIADINKDQLNETKNMLIVLQLRDQENRAVIIGTYRWS